MFVIPCSDARIGRTHAKTPGSVGTDQLPSDFPADAAYDKPGVSGCAWSRVRTTLLDVGTLTCNLLDALSVASHFGCNQDMPGFLARIQELFQVLAHRTCLVHMCSSLTSGRQPSGAGSAVAAVQAVSISVCCSQ
jgi:hypothetical protein